MVSPLIALIKDQMEHLAKLRIVAESINSKMGEKERKRVIDDLSNMVCTGCPIFTIVSNFWSPTDKKIWHEFR